MTPFFDPHRHSQDNFFFESRFVFWGYAAAAVEAGAQPEAQKSVAEGPPQAPAPGPKPAREFDDERDKALGHLNQIDTAFPQNHPQRSQAETLRTKLDQEIRTQFDALHSDYDQAFTALTPPPEEAAVQRLKEQYQPRADGLIADIKTRLDTEDEVKAEVEAHTKETQGPKKTKYIDKNLTTLGRRLARALELTPDQTKALLETHDVLKSMLATLPLDLLQKLEKDFKLTDKQKMEITKVVPKTEAGVEKGEQELLAKMTARGGPLEHLPLDYKEGASYALAKAHRFEQTADGKYLVDDQELTTANRGDLIPELAPFFQTASRPLEAGETEEVRINKCRATLAPLDKQGSAQEKADKAMADLQDAFRNSKDIKKMGTKELISFALQLWAVAKAALTENPPDFETLGEMVQDITDQPMRNPAEVMAKNRTNYGKILENQKPSLNTLLGCYTEPRGEASKVLFSKENAEAAGVNDPKELKDIGRYMNEVRPLIQANLGKGLELKIASIEFHVETGITEITAYKGNKRIALDIDRGDGTGPMKVTLVPYESKPTAEDPNAIARAEGQVPPAAVTTIEQFKDLVEDKKPATAEKPTPPPAVATPEPSPSAPAPPATPASKAAPKRATPRKK